jgi:hypothetical protein
MQCEPTRQERLLRECNLVFANVDTNCENLQSMLGFQNGFMLSLIMANSPSPVSSKRSSDNKRVECVISSLPPISITSYRFTMALQ